MRRRRSLEAGQPSGRRRVRSRSARRARGDELDEVVEAILRSPRKYRAYSREDAHLAPNGSIDHDRTRTTGTEPRRTRKIPDRSWRRREVIDPRRAVRVEDSCSEASRISWHPRTDAEEFRRAFEVGAKCFAERESRSVGVVARDDHAGHVQDRCNLSSDGGEELF